MPLGHDACGQPTYFMERNHMDPKSDKPQQMFVNPFALWTNLALKTGEAMLASAQAVTAQAAARRIAVIPTADAPPLRALAPASPAVEPNRTKRTPAKKAPRRAKAKRVNAKARSKAKGRRKARARR